MALGVSHQRSARGAVLAIAVLRVPESRDENAAHEIDWSGALLATVGLGGARIRSDPVQWRTPPGTSRAPSFIAAGLIVLRPVRGRGTARGAPDDAARDVFGIARVRDREPLHVGALLALGGSLYFFPYVLIDVQGYSPTAAGATFLPFVILQFALLALVGRARAPARRAHSAGHRGGVRRLRVRPAIQPARLGSTNYWTTYFPAVLLLGIGAVFFIAPLTTTVFDSSDPALSGLASGINNAVARTAGLLAIALFGIVFAEGVRRRLRRAVSSGPHVSGPLPGPWPMREQAKFAAGTVPPDVPAADRPAVLGAVRAGYLAGFRSVQYGSAGGVLRRRSDRVFRPAGRRGKRAEQSRASDRRAVDGARPA